MGAINSGASKTISATLAFIVIYGSTNAQGNGVYGCRSGVVSPIVDASGVTVTASNTTYTITNNYAAALRWLIITN